MSWQKSRRKAKYTKRLVKPPLTVRLAIDTTQLENAIAHIYSVFGSPKLQESVTRVFKGAADAMSRFDSVLVTFGSGFSNLQPKGIGDASCRFNARSPHLRCAVNPCGPCEECESYQSSAQ